jgi:hypothetical protein
MQRKRKDEYRSGAEVVFAQWLDQRGIEYEYERHKIKYTSSIKGGRCSKCGGAAIQERVYTPDFYFPGLDFFIEVKGRLDSPTRKKMRDVKRDNPDRDVRFLLMADNKITPRKPERYSDWCKKFDYQYCIKFPPDEWFKNKD